jgi:hypothetical protein
MDHDTAKRLIYSSTQSWQGGMDRVNLAVDRTTEEVF